MSGAFVDFRKRSFSSQQARSASAGFVLCVLVVSSCVGRSACGQEAKTDDGVSERAARMRRLAKACLDYHSRHKSYPVSGETAEHFDDSGRPHLSWRVHILPRLGYQKLYDRFHLDEAWDSEHNRKLLSEMPREYATTTTDTPKTTLMTLISDPRQRVVTVMTSRVVGDRTLAPRMAQVIDGTVFALLFAEMAPELAVPWTRPADAAYEADKPLPKFGRQGESFVLLSNAAGQILQVPRSAPEEVWRALATRNGLEMVDRKWLSVVKTKNTAAQPEAARERR